MKISDMVQAAHKTATEHGWHDESRAFGELIALCHSELSEALEEHRVHKEPTEIYYEDSKPCGIPIELADVLIRIADMCGLYKIDLEGAVKVKLNYNETRPYRHGNKAL